MKLAFILASRNDGFSGTHHVKRLQLTLESINALPCEKEIVLVDFCPGNTCWPSFGLSNLSVVTVPDSALEILRQDSETPLKFYEYLAKEIGTRKTSAPYLVFTNPDCILPAAKFSAVLEQLRHGQIARAMRHDVINCDSLPIDDLRAKAELDKLPVCATFGTAAGDFTAIPRSLYRRLGGYRLCHGIWDVDNDLIRRAEAAGIIIDFQYQQYHLVHTSSTAGMAQVLAEQHPPISAKALRAVFKTVNSDGYLASERWQSECNTASDINEHLPVMWRYGSECESIAEFGVRWAASTSAWMAAKPKKLTCYDINVPRDIRQLESIAADSDIDFEFVQGDTAAAKIAPTDLLFLDTLHNERHLTAEVLNNHHNVRKYMVFHDTEENGWRGDDGGDGLKKTLIEFLLHHPEWRVEAHYMNNHGLTILRRTA